MHFHFSAATTVAIALASGVVATALARHMRLPGIVLLLGAGVLLGPDMMNWVRPEEHLSGGGLQMLVGFAVAVILFEGGMNLNLRRLRRQATVIRRLLTVGVVITAICAGVASHFLMGWQWHFSALFGTLVVVTGPTVITPLLRRLKINQKLSTVLEAEGVLIDAVGALVAVLTLEIALVFLEAGPITWDGNFLDTVRQVGAQFYQGLANLLEVHDPSVWTLLLFNPLSFGLVTGLAGGVLISRMLRFEHAIPEGLENVFTLSLMLVLFQASNAKVEESGILAVIIAGMVVGHIRTRSMRDLMEFKEQLTVMLIGMLFVILAAGVRLEDIRDLGWSGVAVVLVLMLVARPLNVLACTYGQGFDWREIALLSWLAPRGVVAAAVASLIGQTMDDRGVPGGDRFQALVFMVIAVTVVVQGLSGGVVAGLLGLRRPTNRGYAILGANELGHAMGRLLRDSGEEVTFLDSNPAACQVVERDGFRVVFGNVLEERTLLRARLDDRAACIGLTPNQEANLLFAQRASEEFKVPRIFVALARGGGGVSPGLVHEAGGKVLFGQPRDLELWALRLRRGIAPIEMWRFEGITVVEEADETDALDMPENRLLPLVVWRGNQVFPANDSDGIREDDVVHVAILAERREEAIDWLMGQGWTAVYPEQERAEQAAADPTAGNA